MSSANDVTDELLGPAGFERYEVSNSARQGHRCRHNLAYWQRAPVEALGPGAHAFDGAYQRRWTTARLDRYLAALVGQSALPPGGVDELDEPAARAEEHDQVVQVAGALERERLVLDDVEDLEREALVHRWIDDEPGGVERVGEHLVERQVPGAELALVGEEDDERLARPLAERDLGHPRSQAAEGAVEGLAQQILRKEVNASVHADLLGRLKTEL